MERPQQKLIKTTHYFQACFKSLRFYDEAGALPGRVRGTKLKAVTVDYANVPGSSAGCTTRRERFCGHSLRFRQLF